MDEFKPEDELKPDTSDRRPTRSRKTSSAPKVAVSRQHMMMGIGILVLLLLVIGIGSALNGPDDGQKTQQPVRGNTGNAGNAPSGGEKSIDLSGSSSISGQPAEQQPATDSTANSAGNGQPISVPPISPTPTQAEPVQTPPGQQRVELPGDLNSALSSQQDQVNAAAQGASNSGSSLPTAPATVAGGQQSQATPPASKPAQHQATAQQHKPAATHKPAASKPASQPASKPAATASRAPAASSGSAPGGNYTLQLSSASRSDTLNAWAKKQNLSGYHVYKTTRNGQPWYVLVSGSYATPADAKRAVAALPAEVRAQSPWVKPVSQVKKESVN
ncbi:SPOR domain-containing protein [Erwiniaceae bacterium BAC15a-03b]|uniref:Cell division protein DamX n=1 Tax=Winslowiella arboricola TaxID=2978220 RepID=A0A9J6PRX9_9GAMM|nr:SPOR domain-containing protein [Winslowiella arboricola]MCU5771854.1 SPOR domain-containing protein [Winslowiella arboricola]MCU5777484.1 SPOR domain-containing protein [Winslowiella arboricola]